MALSEHQRQRARIELEERVAQEQFLQFATVPVSNVIEEFLREEKEMLKAEHDNGPVGK